MPDEAILRIILQGQGDSSSGGSTAGSSQAEYFIKEIGGLNKMFAVFESLGEGLKNSGRGIDTFRTLEEAQALLNKLTAASTSSGSSTSTSGSSLPPTTLEPPSVGASTMMPKTSFGQTMIEPPSTGAIGSMPDWMRYDPDIRHSEPSESFDLSTDAWYAKLPSLKAMPVFDPMAEAKKRKRREIEKEQIEEAYKDMYGEDEKGASLLDIAKQMRGMLGGSLGTLAGASLDLMSGAAGAGGIAGAAGPVGLAIAAGEAINKLIKGGIKGVIGGVGGVASEIASANADPSVPIGKLGDAASQASEYLGGFGHGLLVVGESLKAFSSVMRELDATARRYGEYSPEISQAQAVAEIRQTMGDFRRAQQISTQMATFVLEQSNLQQRFEDIKIKLLTQMLPIMNAVLSGMETIMETGEATADAIKALTSPLTELAKIAKEMLNMRKDENIHDVEDPSTLINNPRFFESVDVGGFAPNR